MTNSKKKAFSFLSIIVLVALIITLPVLASNNDDAMLDHVVFKVGDDYVVVDLEDYGDAFRLEGDPLWEYLRDGEEVPHVHAVVSGDKYMDIEEYGENYIDDVSEAIAKTDALPADEVATFKMLIGFDEDDEPIFEPIDEVLRVTAVEAVNDLEEDEFVVTATMNMEPEEAPVNDDFTVEVAVNDDDWADTVVEEGEYAWDETELEASWTWDAIQKTGEQQEVKVAVEYLTTGAETYSFTIPAVEVYFKPSIDAPDNIEPGETLEVAWIIENIGSEEGTQEVVREVILKDADDEVKHQADTSEELTISAGEEVVWHTSTIDTSEGNWEAEVPDKFELILETEDETDIHEVDVFDPDYPVHRYDADDKFARAHSTIDYALGDAAQDHTIIVYPGEYEESVVIGVEGLTLESVEKHEATIKGTFEIDANDVTIEGFKLKGDGSGRAMNPTSATSGVNILNNHVEKYLTGIYLDEHDDAVIKGNYFTENTAGIGGWQADGVEVVDNDFIKNNHGIGIHSDAENKVLIIEGNYFQENPDKGHVKCWFDDDDTLDPDDVIADNDFEKDVVISYTPPAGEWAIFDAELLAGKVDAGESEAYAEDNEDGSATIYAEVNDFFGEPVTGLEYDDFAWRNDDEFLPWPDGVGGFRLDVDSFEEFEDGKYRWVIEHDEDRNRIWDVWAYCEINEEMEKIEEEMEVKITGPGLPDSIEILAQPADTAVGQVIGSDNNDYDYPTVKVTDEDGTPVPDVEVQTGIQGEAWGDGPFEEGTTVRATDNEGVAIFDDLVIGEAEDGKQLIFKDVETENITTGSDSFNVYEPEVDENASSATLDDSPYMAIDMTASVIDQYGNPITGLGKDEIRVDRYWDGAFIEETLAEYVDDDRWEVYDLEEDPEGEYSWRIERVDGIEVTYDDWKVFIYCLTKEVMEEIHHGDESFEIDE